MDIIIVLDDCIPLSIYIFHQDYIFHDSHTYGLSGSSSLFYDVAKKLANQGRPRKAWLLTENINKSRLSLLGTSSLDDMQKSNCISQLSESWRRYQRRCGRDRGECPGSQANQQAAPECTRWACLSEWSPSPPWWTCPPPRALLAAGNIHDNGTHLRAQIYEHIYRRRGISLAREVEINSDQACILTTRAHGGELTTALSMKMAMCCVVVPLWDYLSTSVYL